MRLRKESCRLDDCADAVAYLTSRGLWPAAAASTLKAHVSVEYFADGQMRVGRYPALVADVRNIEGALIAAHITYLEAGHKLKGHEPRKMCGKVNGHDGCAVRLGPLTSDVMGIAEGIETAIAAAALHRVTVWAALGTALLAKFDPPATVRKLIIFADRDIPGLAAAGQLTERLQGRVALELRPPDAPTKDWNDSMITS